MKAKITLAVGLAIAVSLVSAAREAPAPGQEGKPDPTLTLKIGNPKLSGKTMDVERKGVHSAETGGTVPFERMI